MTSSMTPEEWDQIVELFSSTRERPIEEWNDILDSACGANRSLREAVESMLREDNAASGYLSRPIVERFLSSTEETIVKEGQVFGRYTTVRLLGRGGMGEVWVARDAELQRLVALKFPSRRAILGGPPNQISREAKTASALNHPNIITVHEVVAGPDSPMMIVMEFVDGHSLRIAAKLHLTTGRILDLAVQIAEALAAAHSVGIIHKDLKPENILVRDDGYVKILDFGLAAHTRDEAELEAHPPAGTLRYMSPEQLRAERVTTASDVFSLGLVLHEMLTGTHPFAGRTAMEIVRAILRDERAAGRFQPQYSEPLTALILSMLAHEPTVRPTMKQVVVRLESLQQRPRFGWKSRLAVAGLIATLLFAALKGLIWNPGKQQALPIRQMTAALPEDHVTAAAIAFDGKSFAFATATGLFLQDIATAKIHVLKAPFDLLVDKIAWLPGGNRLVISGLGARTNRRSIWIASTGQTDPIMVVASGAGGTASPGGDAIAYTDPKSQEIWVVHSDGTGAHCIVKGPPNETFPMLSFLSNGSLLAFQRKRNFAEMRPPSATRQFHSETYSDRSYEVVNVKTGQITAVQDDMWIKSGASLSDGRFDFVRWYPSGAATPDQLWEARTDPNTGAFVESPHRIAETGIPWEGITATADGRNLMMLRFNQNEEIFVGDFSAKEAVISAVRRLTRNERFNYPHSWTTDSRAVFYESTRNDSWGIYRQDIDKQFPSLIYASVDRNFTPQSTTDGKWVLFGSQSDNVKRARKLMRMPVDGGRAESVSIGGDLDDFACPQRPKTSCVLRRTIGEKEFQFFALDPVRGVGRLLARTRWEPLSFGAWGLSPDGTAIAMPDNQGDLPHIRVVQLFRAAKEPAETTIAVPGMDPLAGIIWISATDGWLATVQVEGDFARHLAHVYPDGSFRWMNGIHGWGNPSPDGKHIVFLNEAETTNAWLFTRR